MNNFNFFTDEDTKVKSYTYNYDDSFFDSSTLDPDYNLLKFSICLALSADKEEWVTQILRDTGFSFTNNVDEIAEGLNVLNGDKITDSVYYPAQRIDGKDFYNSIGYSIGWKRKEEETLVLLTVRGGYYGLEWGGDFILGSGEVHEGLSIAADQVIQGLKDTLKRENITGKIKLLLSGYSRGAGTINIVAKRLDDGEIEGLNRDNVYAFGFEVPRVTRAADWNDSKYDNIISIVNPDDFVPKIAPAVWGFKHYGRVFHLPASTTENPEKYHEIADKVREEYAKIMGLENFIDLNITLNLKCQDMDIFVDDFAFVLGSQENYVKEYQTQFSKFFALFFGMDMNPVSTEEEKTILGVIEKIDQMRPDSRFRGFDKLALHQLISEHSMGYTLSWVNALGSLSNYGPNEYIATLISSPEDLYIPDQNFSADTPDDMGFFKIVYYRTVDSLLLMELEIPRYFIYTDILYDMTSGRVKKIKSAAYDTEGMVVLDINQDKIELKTAKEIIKPVFEKELKNPEYIKAFVRSEIEDKVYGSGYYPTGCFMIPVIEDPPRSFTGWYEGDEEISDQRGVVVFLEKDTEITAK